MIGDLTMCDHNYLHAPRALQAYSGRFNGVNLGDNASSSQVRMLGSERRGHVNKPSTR